MKNEVNPWRPYSRGDLGEFFCYLDSVDILFGKFFTFWVVYRDKSFAPGRRGQHFEAPLSLGAKNGFAESADFGFGDFGFGLGFGLSFGLRFGHSASGMMVDEESGRQSSFENSKFTTLPTRTTNI
jgi:hypothetical protein